MKHERERLRKASLAATTDQGDQRQAEQGTYPDTSSWNLLVNEKQKQGVLLSSAPGGRRQSAKRGT
jgi:hypothetical protein